jgi:hypothetical protein
MGEFEDLCLLVFLSETAFQWLVHKIKEGTESLMNGGSGCHLVTGISARFVIAYVR